jgi:hypothetical protein
LHGGIKVWCIQLCTFIIDTAKLTKYKRWLPVLVCLLTLAKINKFVATHYELVFQDRHEYIKPNINALIEKWMPCDMFWTPRFPRFGYTIKLKGNEEYHPERIQKRKFLLPNPYEKL